jgi:ATP-dependent 26S proteasome regulatory subunit
MDPSFMLNAMMLNRINSDNTLIGILSTVVGFILFSFMTNKMKTMSFDISYINWKQLTDWNHIVKYFSKKNKVEYEGKLTSRMDRFENRVYQSTCFSNNFSALWKYIIDSANSNPTIYSIKECNISMKTDEEKDNIYVVNQMTEFLIDAEKEIYAFAYNYRESNEEEDTTGKKTPGNSANKTDRIIIELYSCVSNVAQIKSFVDDLTAKYLASIEAQREHKQFVYSLAKLDFDDFSYERWKESPFESTRTFQNLFFDNREMVLKKVDYFLQNKAWYFEKGIPYSLGIGLHGPPGTGKTSFIKALANYTKRHIVTISLKMIKTKKQLDGVFFEDRYSGCNKKNSVGFDKKIIVFEDIDCIGDIVKDRAKKVAQQPVYLPNVNPFSIPDDKELKNGFVKIDGLTAKPIEDPITLDDILNLWDGICETPGRIMVLTSNHYEELDPALKRPGRIDITLEMQKASREIIAEMHRHLFKQDICDDVLARIPDREYSPAEIVNVYMNENNDSARFCERLVSNS